jgi:hypothetical protein
MTTLTPVEGDPFAAAAPDSTEIRLTPVEGNPFQPDFGIDWGRSVAEVRKEIAKLPEEDRPEALRQWADAYVARERAPLRERGQTSADDVVRLTSRGTIAGPWLDEANALTASALHTVTGGAAGAPYDEAVAYQRAIDRAIDDEYGWAGTGLQVAGGLASGGAAYRTARALALPTLARSSVPANMAVGAGVGAVHGASAAAGNSEGTVEERLAAVPAGAGTGAAVGAALPPALRLTGMALRYPLDWASPTIEAVKANLRQIPRRIGISASADGGVPMSPGAVAAAEERAAAAAVRGGVTGEQLREALDPSSTRFWSNSFAEDARVLADLDPSLQRLAGSAARASPEAGTIAETVMRARQTGLTPPRPREQAMVAEAGVPTRESMARVRASDRPAGQLERIRNAFRRAMLIEDKDFHGHLGTGRRTEQSIVDQARQDADQLYTEAYQAGESVDIPAALAPVFAQWQQRLANQAEPVQALLGRLMQSFGRSRSLEQFDRNKRYLLDAKIEQLRSSPVGRNPESAGVLTQFKNDLMAAVDGIPNAGNLYRTARDAFESQMTLRDALRAGREAFREQSEVGVDAFRALQTDGERKLFRLGLLDSFTDAAARMRSGADRLSLFDNPRIREILSEVLPRRGSFDNPRTFGRLLDTEGRMVQTRNEVVGNSKTAQRLADDEAYKAMGMIEESIGVFRNSGVTAGALNLTGRYLQRFFGMSQDTSVALARMLFTADPVQRQQNLERIIARMGANRAAQLARYLQQHQSMLTGAAARATPPGGP